VWAQVIVATNIAETSITIDDIVCALKQARAQPNKRTTEADARTH
jgi:HrpA-like RNA helicase